jgi:hypothetical protein
MSTGETIPDEPLEQIRATVTGLLLDGEGGSWGSGPEGLTSRHVNYMLPGESIGEGGTFYVVDCDYSKLSLLVSMSQYSDIETVEQKMFAEDEINAVLGEYDLPHMPQPVRAKEEDTPLVLVTFFDIEKDYIKGVDEIHATDTEASDEELSKLIKIIGHPDLEPLILTDEHDPKFNWTSTHHLERRIAASHGAFLRVAGDNPIAVQWADWSFRGIGERPGEEVPAAPSKGERALPSIVKWLSGRFRGGNV